MDGFAAVDTKTWPCKDESNLAIKLCVCEYACLCYFAVQTRAG